MSISCEHSNPLIREGTTQVQRLLDALVPENMKLHELTPEDWLGFAKDYASLINFFKLTNATILTDEPGLNNNPKPDGDWENFFPEKDAIEETLKKYFNGTIEPHLSLFVAFLKLLDYPQASLNGIPKRHLDFYYKEVLQLSPQAFSPDTVHVVFEMAKNAISELVEGGSLLEAGKDSEGNPINYAMDSNFVTDQTQVVAMHSIYTDEENKLKYATQPNTIKGMGEPLEGDLTWSAFGDNEWLEVDLEIALAGEIFALKEGERIITVDCSLTENFGYNGLIFASLTTEEGWTEEIQAIPDPANKKSWTIEIPVDEKPITAYYEEIHLKRMNTTLPVLKFRFDSADAYKALKNVKVTKIDVTVAVIGVTDLIVQNEIGVQLPDKPFMPFGPRPKKNSALTIESKEFVGKNISSFDVNFNWLNVPPNFSNHYKHYEDVIAAQKVNTFNNLGYALLYDTPIVQTYTMFTLNNLFATETIPTEVVETDVMRKEFKLSVSSDFQKEDSIGEMFTETPQVIIPKEKILENLKGGKITLKLLESFYHDLYNGIYVSVVSKSGQLIPKEDNSGDLETYTVKPEDLPNEPYTPLANSLSLDYSAKASLSFEDGDTLNLIHLNPFGSQILTPLSPEKTLLPNYRKNSFYIGLSNAKARDNVSILFQVAEGSEDPALSSFGPFDGIEWAVLTAEDNLWQKLTEEHIIQNTTNNFLRSGIVQFSLPKESVSNNYLLDDGLIWLKAELEKKPKAIARFVGVHTQAATATFENNSNVLDHLDAGLPPGEIKQLAQRKSKIKSVQQPYASFGGRNTETDTNFYRRISERLRHKDRALTLWDYEHLTLQAFPKIYKVKCLNHTKYDGNKVDELCPGHVTLVIVPKVTDANASLALYPSVSQNTKDEIKNYLAPKHGHHVNLEVANPIYELVQFDFKVRFYAQYDYNLYKGILSEDLIALLAPWAFDPTAEIKFNNTIYEYDVINFMENLEYVDYIEEFKMNHIPTEGVINPEKRIAPSNALAVLAPAQSHKIEEAQIC